MSEYAVSGPALKKLIKKAKKGPVSFAYNPGKGEDDNYFGMHLLKTPQVIAREAKAEGAGPKAAFGTSMVVGKEFQLTCEIVLPGMAKKLKKFLKANKVMLNIVIMDASGNILESDIEDMPDDPDMDDDEDGNSPAESPAVAPSIATSPPVGEAIPEIAAKAGGAFDARALAQRLLALRDGLKALPEAMASKLLPAVQQTAGTLKEGDLQKAADNIEKLENTVSKLLERAAPPVAATQPNPQAQKLNQVLEGLRAQATSVPDADRRQKIEQALDRAGNLIAQLEIEAATMLLTKMRILLQPAPPIPTASDTATTEAEPEDLAAQWAKVFAELNDKISRATSEGLVVDPDGLRKAWAWCTNNAADYAYSKAMETLPDVRARLARLAGGDQNAFAQDVPADAKPFAMARLTWRTTRSTMRSELGKVETAILAYCSEMEGMEEVVSNISTLAGHLVTLDDRLETKLDQIVNQPAGPGRESLKAEAQGLIAEYRRALESDFFNDIDEGSGFASVAVTSTARTALSDIAKVLA